MTPDLSPLFEPRGIIVTGVSSHPGKFGFVTLHNLLACGYAGRVFPIGREPGTILDTEVLTSIDDVPPGAADLVFMCTPAAANEDLLRAAASKGVRAAFVTSAGYGEGDGSGAGAESALVELATELGVTLCGPNGQGVISTPVSMCAQIVAPYPPPGRIAIASQSGNFVSSFQNLAAHAGVGISRAVSAGNAAATGVLDYLEWFADDEETNVSLVYAESIPDGREFYRRVRAVSARKPVVLLKGGATTGGQRAAASHTGAMATDDRAFDGMARQAGLVRAVDVEDALGAAAAFATQPLPRGPNVAVLTTAGGWGVVTADAITASRDLVLAALPDDLLAAIDAKLPPRWSRNNPIDLAGGETRDTVVDLIDIVAGHDAIDAVVFLGLGIQSNQAALMRRGGFYPEHGLERIVDYHERQDARYATAAAEAREATGKPVLVATELSVSNPDNAGVATTRANGSWCAPSANHAVRALEHLVRYATWRRARGL